MIRFAAADDLPAIRRLWEQCFPDEGGFNDYFFAQLYTLRHTLLCVEDGVLCAMTQMLPYRLCLRGAACDVTYIYGACTDPAHRRQGHMARLLRRSFELDRAAGRAASVLIPAEPWLFDFYAAFGYRRAFYLEKRSVSRNGAGEIPRRLTAADIPALERCYQHAMHEEGGYVCRPAEEWERQLALFDALGAGGYGWFVDGQLDGYAFCWQDHAQEAVGLTDARANGLLKVLALDRCTVCEPGGQLPLGVALWYDEADKHAEDRCYMNLMLN